MPNDPEGTEVFREASQCSNCRFWRRSKTQRSIGHCRRNPPVIVDSFIDREEPDLEFASCWPMTQYDEWCGEFIHKDRM